MIRTRIFMWLIIHKSFQKIVKRNRCFILYFLNEVLLKIKSAYELPLKVYSNDRKLSIITICRDKYN